MSESNVFKLSSISSRSSKFYKNCAIFYLVKTQYPLSFSCSFQILLYHKEVRKGSKYYLPSNICCERMSIFFRSKEENNMQQTIFRPQPSPRNEYSAQKILKIWRKKQQCKPFYQNHIQATC